MAAQERNKGIPTSTWKSARGETSSRRLALAFPLNLLAVILAIVLGAVALGVGIVWASSDTLPGDLLYPVKLATEDLRLALASAPRGEVDLALQFLEERTSEIRAVVQAGHEVPDETLARLEQHIERALTQTAWAGEDEMNGLLMRIAERTRTQAQVLEWVREKAPDKAKDGLDRAVDACQWGAEMAEDGLKDPGAFRRRYRPYQAEPKPTDESQQNQEPRQDRNHRRGDDEYAPLSTPQRPQMTPRSSLPRHGPSATPTLEPTSNAMDSMKKPAPTTTAEPTAAGPPATLRPTESGPEATSPGVQATPQGPLPSPRQDGGMSSPQAPGGKQGGRH